MFIDAFRTQMWVEPLGWTLLHSIWQGVVIAVVTWLVLRRYGVQLRSRTRYALCCAALGLSVVIPVVTFALFIVSPDRGGMAHPVAAVAPVADVMTPSTIPSSLSAGAALVLPWVVLAWMIAIALWPWLQIGNPWQQFKIALMHFTNIPMAYEFSYWGERIWTDGLPRSYIPGQIGRASCRERV